MSRLHLIKHNNPVALVQAARSTTRVGSPSGLPFLAVVGAGHVGGDPTSAAFVLRRFRVVFNAVRSHFQQVEFEGVLPEALGRLPAPTLLRLDYDLAELIQLLKADEQAGGIPLAEL